jgi:hypothetical protein
MNHERINTPTPGFRETTAGLWRNVQRSREYTAVMQSQRSTAQPSPVEVLNRYQKAHREELSDAEHATLSVLAKLGSFVDVSHELRDERHRSDHHRLSQYEFDNQRRLKDTYLIPFNHDLKNLINHHPSVEQDEFVGTLAAAYQGLYKDYDARRQASRRTYADMNKVYATLEDVTIGMKHEVAAETMLTAAGVNFDSDVSVKEDATANDLYVDVFNDGEWHGIDLKSSEFSEKRALERHIDSLPVWSGLNESDFKGMKGNAFCGLTIPYDTASRKGPEFVQRIKDNMRYQAARRIGRSVLVSQ